MKAIVVATELNDATQAMYVDGVLRAQEDTIYVSAIMGCVADDEPIVLSQLEVELPESFDWPESLEALRQMVVAANTFGGESQ